jgi:hypothetical protein
MQGLQSEIGGCKLLLVVYKLSLLFFSLSWLKIELKYLFCTNHFSIFYQIPYFEFLITSEFNLGHSIPRLPLWTTHVVNSYIALDSVHGSVRCFGRLAVWFPHLFICTTSLKNL